MKSTDIIDQCMPPFGCPCPSVVVVVVVVVVNKRKVKFLADYVKSINHAIVYTRCLLVSHKMN